MLILNYVLIKIIIFIVFFSTGFTQFFSGRTRDLSGPNFFFTLSGQVWCYAGSKRKWKRVYKNLTVSAVSPCDKRTRKIIAAARKSIENLNLRFRSVFPMHIWTTNNNGGRRYHVKGTIKSDKSFKSTQTYLIDASCKLKHSVSEHVVTTCCCEIKPWVDEF